MLDDSIYYIAKKEKRKT